VHAAEHESAEGLAERVPEVEVPDVVEAKEMQRAGGAGLEVEREPGRAGMRDGVGGVVGGRSFGRRRTEDGRNGEFTGACHRRLYTGFERRFRRNAPYLVVELGIDDFEFLSFADGGDEFLEEFGFDEGIDVGVLDGDAGGEGVVVEAETIDRALMSFWRSARTGAKMGESLRASMARTARKSRVSSLSVMTWASMGVNEWV
jgi:hypothetical protein